MARAPTDHACAACGHRTARWEGRCPGCGAYGTLEPVAPARTPAGRARSTAPAGTGAVRPTRLADVVAPRVPRVPTGVTELDRVLGGGLVPGSVVLLGGPPGIGKSTLLGVMLGHVAGRGASTLYVSGEESAAQVRLRAERLAHTGAGGAPGALEVPVVCETDLDAVVETLAVQRPDVCVVDSVQTLGSAGSSPGSVGQVREAAGRIMEVAKAQGTAVVLVGHVTKEGALAGPRVLEHLVDVVLQFDGERERTYRTLRASKNRFGSTEEAGVFDMRPDGLVEVPDPSSRFVGEASRAHGSVVLCAMEGTRPLLVEVQALVASSELEQPRRVAGGVDRNRLAIVLAVLGRHAGVSVGASDVFVSVVGGVRAHEPGADLAIALAVASAARGRPLGGSDAGGTAAPLACFGEIGLTGELRSVAHAERRAAEARRFGLRAPVEPATAATLREAVGAALPTSGGGL